MSKIPPRPTISLSKSLFIKGMQCNKALWLKKYKKEVLTPPSAQTLAIFKTGNEVGNLACKLFPNGKKIPFEGISFQEKIELTKKWMDEGVETIYEATFSYNGILVMVDILNKTNDGWAICEVKSSTYNDSKSIDDISLYVLDVAIQYYVLSGCGISISKTSLIMINNTYVRKETLELEKLFITIPVDKEVSLWQKDIPTYLRNFQSILIDNENEPDIDIGHHCNTPYSCEAKDYCWKVQRKIPEYSVFDIFAMTKKAKSIQLYRKGIVKIEDIPDNFSLTERQSFLVNSHKTKKKFIDKENIKLFLKDITYPIYYLDFETTNEAIPQYKGVKPYQQLVFQYSLHIEHANGSLEHKEFLAKEDSDPRKQLVKQLTKDIQSDVTLIAYNASFEKGIMKNLAETYPKYAKHLNAIKDNIIDLAKPFQNRSYYLPQMKGKYSIKIVLPLLIPKMEEAYKKLSLVSNGSDAMNLFPKLREMPKKEREAYRKALLEYCKLDTLAMVKILNILREEIKNFTNQP